MGICAFFVFMAAGLTWGLLGFIPALFVLVFGLGIVARPKR